MEAAVVSAHSLGWERRRENPRGRASRVTLALGKDYGVECLEKGEPQAKSASVHFSVVWISYLNTVKSPLLSRLFFGSAEELAAARRCFTTWRRKGKNMEKKKKKWFSHPFFLLWHFIFYLSVKLASTAKHINNIKGLNMKVEMKPSLILPSDRDSSSLFFHFVM